MKSYWEIPGPSKAPNSHCIAFDKLDGTNIRVLWQKKKSWVRFGTRHTLFDESSDQWKYVIPIFMGKYAEPLEKILRDSKQYRDTKEILAFLEFFGPNSFAGTHDQQELQRGDGNLVLFDVNVHKKGFVLPRDFVRDFGDKVEIPRVIYEGNFNTSFVEDVKNGVYPVVEGVVAKGVIAGKRSSDQHGLWMAKVKTKKWIERLKEKCSGQDNDGLKNILEDNLQEQK